MVSWQEKHKIMKTHKINIAEIMTTDNLSEISTVIRESFITVANDFGITKENAPTNPAFITDENLKKSIEKGLKLYSLLLNQQISGCIGIEKAIDDENVFYIERLAVLPEYRHNGYGKVLLDFAFCKIKSLNGKNVNIGIINNNIKLKNWYKDYGFIETGIKKFEHQPFDVCFMTKIVI